MKKISLFFTLFIIGLVACNPAEQKQESTKQVISSDPLPSWAEGDLKSSIISFVNGVTEDGGPTYVNPEDRIATFDQDGTLWCEMPLVQLEYVVYRIKELAPEHPEWKNELPYKAVLDGDLEYLIKDVEENSGHEVIKLVLETHAGMSLDQFNGDVAAFFKDARHPKYDKPYTETIYQPMLELLIYLRANEFKTYICSGGGLDFMRVISEPTYGIVPENVIGSFAMNSFKEVDGKWEIVKEGKGLFICDKNTKPTAIDQHIGRIPIFVAGNVRTGGDIGQLTYSGTNSLPNFQLLINHNDSIREFAYSEENSESLNAAKAGNWHVVSMKDDWLSIFPFKE